MKLKPIPYALILASVSSGALANPSWIDWVNTSTGSFMVGATTVGVSLTGSAPADLVNGDYYYNNASTGGTSVLGTYGGLTPSDLLQVKAASSFKLTFSQAILNPYVALVSVGQGGLPITYTFTGPVSVLTSGPNIWGNGSYTYSGSSFTGREYNGVLQLAGSYTSLTITTSPNENWHGFNIGTNALAAPVPEPETYAMMLAGLGMLGFIARRRKLKAAA